MENVIFCAVLCMTFQWMPGIKGLKKKFVLKHFTKLTGKHLQWCPIFLKLQTQIYVEDAGQKIQLKRDSLQRCLNQLQPCKLAPLKKLCESGCFRRLLSCSAVRRSSSSITPNSIPTTNRSSHPEMFLGKGVLKICSKFT